MGFKKEKTSKGIHGGKQTRLSGYGCLKEDEAPGSPVSQQGSEM